MLIHSCATLRSQIQQISVFAALVCGLKICLDTAHLRGTAFTLAYLHDDLLLIYLSRLS